MCEKLTDNFFVNLNQNREKKYKKKIVDLFPRELSERENVSENFFWRWRKFEKLNFV